MAKRYFGLYWPHYRITSNEIPSGLIFRPPPARPVKNPSPENLPSISRELSPENFPCQHPGEPPHSLKRLPWGSFGGEIRGTPYSFFYGNRGKFPQGRFPGEDSLCLFYGSEGDGSLERVIFLEGVLSLDVYGKSQSVPSPSPSPPLFGILLLVPPPPPPL